MIKMQIPIIFNGHTYILLNAINCTIVDPIIFLSKSDTHSYESDDIFNSDRRFFSREELETT